MINLNTKEGGIRFHYGIIDRGQINNRIKLFSFISVESKKIIFEIYIDSSDKQKFFFVKIHTEKDAHSLKAAIDDWFPNEKHEILFQWKNGKTKHYDLIIDGKVKDSITTELDLRDQEITLENFTS